MTRPRMAQIAANAVLYWAAIFALGFVLGTLRTLWLAAWLWQMQAVLIELPVMLAASWFWARWVLRRRPLPTRGAALAMGGLAFALLMAAELVLALALAGQTAGEWLAGLVEPPGLAGLSGQVLFALMPGWVWGLGEPPT